MAGFNWVDLVLIAMLLVGMAWGYAQGVMRQAIGLLAIYIGLVLATQFFVPLTQVYAHLTLNPPNTLSNAISFFVILFGVMFLFNLLALDAFKSMRLQIFPFFDHLGGMALGVIGMWILITVIVNVLTFAVNTQDWGGSADLYRLILTAGLEGSQIALVTTSTLPAIVTAIRPWMPGGLPAIFEL
jgi:membrane protein required for colicin V production